MRAAEIAGERELGLTRTALPEREDGAQLRRRECLRLQPAGGFGRDACKNGDHRLHVRRAEIGRQAPLLSGGAEADAALRSKARAAEIGDRKVGDLQAAIAISEIDFGVAPAEASKLRAFEIGLQRDLLRRLD